MGTGEEDDMVGGFFVGGIAGVVVVVGIWGAAKLEYGRRDEVDWLAGWLASLIGLQSPCEAKELAS